MEKHKMVLDCKMAERKNRYPSIITQGEESRKLNWGNGLVNG